MGKGRSRFIGRRPAGIIMGLKAAPARPEGKVVDKFRVHEIGNLTYNIEVIASKNGKTWLYNKAVGKWLPIEEYGKEGRRLLESGLSAEMAKDAELRAKLFPNLLKLISKDAKAKLALEEIFRNAESKTVVDIGAGTGNLLAGQEFAGFAAKWAMDYVTLPNRHQINPYANPGKDRIHWLKGNATKVPLAASSADVAIATNVIGYLSWPRQGIREVGRVLREGGYAIISDAHLDRHYVADCLKKAGFEIVFLESAPAGAPPEAGLGHAKIIIAKKRWRSGAG